MKKLFFILSLSTFCSVATAQLQKGRMMLGGSFNLRNDKSSSKDTILFSTLVNDQHTKNFSGTLRYGYFISDGFMLGVFGGFNSNITEYTNSTINTNTSSNASNKNSYTGYSAGLFGRYYNMIGKSRFAWFGELSAAYGGGKSKYTSQSNGIPDPSSPLSESKSQNFNAVLRPGITYFFNKTIAAEASFGNLGYSYTKSTSGNESSGNSNTTTNSGINSNLNFSLSNIAIGINFYFGG